MKLGVSHKLFLALFMAASLAAVSSALIMQWNLNRGFLQLANTMEQGSLPRLAAKLEESYGANQSWDAIQNEPREWRQLFDSSLPESVLSSENRQPDGPPRQLERNDESPPPRNGADDRRQPRPPQRRVLLPKETVEQFDRRLFLLNAEKNLVFGGDASTANAQVITLHHQGKNIGYLGLHPQTELLNLPQKDFLKHQEAAFAIVAGIVVVLSAGLSLLLATRLVRPLRKITEATHHLALGEYSVRVPTGADDELGRLATDFNALALAMENNEQARRRWVADISHELRTPLTFLRSQVEAILDGVRQATPEAMQAIHAEILRFKRLVDDLYQLTMSDVGALTYRKEEAGITEILTVAVSLFRPEFSVKNIALVCEIPEEKVSVFGDAERLGQLCANLLDNSLKYTDPGGKLLLTVTSVENDVLIDFQDTAPGVAESDLEHLFERLYRVDSSRNRLTGGAGLGLAICCNIVAAHEGSIEAHASPLGGVWTRVILPRFGRV